MNTAVEFREADHSYWVGHSRWPSVTQILSPLLELDGIPKAVLDAAADFGRNVHAACHLHNLGRLDEADLDEPLRPYLEGWKKFLRDTGAVVLESERIVTHPILKVAGMLDDLLRIPPRNYRHVLDIKSGESIPWTVGMQTAAYREMLWQEERLLPKAQVPEGTLSIVRFCCQLREDATYKLETLDSTNDINEFISVLNVHRIRERHGRRVWQ
jgi:hypothetical protein